MYTDDAEIEQKRAGAKMQRRERDRKGRAQAEKYYLGVPGTIFHYTRCLNDRKRSAKGAGWDVDFLFKACDARHGHAGEDRDI